MHPLASCANPGAETSTDKRTRVFRAVDQLTRDGAGITFAAVARTAKVSNWLVYADGVRVYITAAREHQATEPARTKRSGQLATDASLRTDLELACQDNRSLRQEIAQPKTLLREHLGEQLAAESNHSLRQHIDELTDSNVRYQNENLALTSSNEDLTTQLNAHGADLAAARTSLRRMIREQTSQLDRELGRRVLDNENP